jgi:hypothetical protein
MVESRITDIPFDALGITPDQVMSAMGYSPESAPSILPGMVIDVLAYAGNYAHIASGYSIVNGISSNGGDASLAFGGKRFSTGKIITSQLRNAESIALFVCTAGSLISDWSREHFDNGDFMKGYIIDAVASETVERAAGSLEKELRTQAGAQNLHTSAHYSPGHCGWPVSDQHALFSLLPPNFCGVSLTATALMVPTKSLSGIIGIGPGEFLSVEQCSLCDMPNCFRRNKRTA